mmetsp:Transcript_32304/g.49458  ORF Transcript_32304/g.49458 Transcript_32304/m.49458 type:complete len:157 (-) Transcript_32304:29-499(-)
MIIQRLATTTITLDLPKFKVYTFYSMKFSEVGQVCLGFGWGTDTVDLDITTNFELQECYKTILDDLGDWEKAWNSDTAKWIDSCSTSESQGTINVQSIELVASDSQSVLGGTSIDGEGCWEFATWTDWAPYLAQAGVNALSAGGIIPPSGVSIDLI